MKASTFQRLYVDSTGIEYPATPESVETVLRSMNEHAAGPDPFKVRLRFEDGSAVIAAPKTGRGR